MTQGQKISVSLLISIILATGMSVLSFSGLFDVVEANFYNPRLSESARKEIHAISGSLDDFHSFNQNRFKSFLGKDYVKRSFLPNQSSEDIFSRSNEIGLMQEATPGFVGVRFIDILGKKINFSSLGEDILKKENFSILYRNYGDLTDDIPFDSIKAPDKTGGALHQDPKRSQFVYSFPFYDSFDVYRGTAVFIVSLNQFVSRLLDEGILLAGEDMGFAGASGVVSGVPSRARDVVLDAVRNVYETSPGAAGIPVNENVSGEKLILFSAVSANGFSVGKVYPSSRFVFPFWLKILLLVSVFTSLYLFVYLLFNLKQDSVVALKDRIKRFQVSLLRDILDEKTDSDFSLWRGELEARREDVRKEIKKSLGRIAKSRIGEIDEYIDKSWAEIIDLLAKKLPERSQGIDLQGLEGILKNVLKSGTFVIGQGQVGSAAAESREKPHVVSKPPASSVQAMVTDDVEELEEIGEVEELGDGDSVEAGIGKTTDAEPATGEESRTEEDAEELEEVEAFEEVEEAADAETVEDADEVEEFGEILEEPAETSHEIIAVPAQKVVVPLDESEEEAEVLEELDEAEELEEIGPEEISEISVAVAIPEAIPETEEAENDEELEELEEADDVEELESVADDLEIGDFGDVIEEVEDPGYIEEPESLDEVDSVIHGIPEVPDQIDPDFLLEELDVEAETSEPRDGNVEELAELDNNAIEELVALDDIEGVGLPPRSNREKIEPMQPATKIPARNPVVIKMSETAVAENRFGTPLLDDGSAADLEELDGELLDDYDLYVSSLDLSELENYVDMGQTDDVEELPVVGEIPTALHSEEAGEDAVTGGEITMLSAEMREKLETLETVESVDESEPSAVIEVRGESKPYKPFMARKTVDFRVLSPRMDNVLAFLDGYVEISGNDIAEIIKENPDGTFSIASRVGDQSTQRVNTGLRELAESVLKKN